jgi:hypothetical protein
VDVYLWIIIPSRLYSFLSVVTLLARSHGLSWENLPAVVSRCLPPCPILFILIGPLEPSSSRSGDLGEKWPLNFAYEHLYARKVLLHAVNLLPLRRKWCYGFLSPGLNPRTLGPVASTLTTSPPRTGSCIKEDRHCRYNVILRRVRVTIVAVEKH